MRPDRGLEDSGAHAKTAAMEDPTAGQLDANL
jgi:hypothetical protein